MGLQLQPSMLKLTLPTLPNSQCKVLCLGAHPDDIEIGCGGTILTLIEANPQAQFNWIVFSANKTRAAEARKSFGQFLKRAPAKKLAIKSFRESFFPYQGAELKEYFEEFKQTFNPDLIFTHCRSDLHQDHRLLSELTWNTFRDHLILEYEIPKYDGDLGAPNVFVPLDKATYEKKVSSILQCFRSQKSKLWFDEGTLMSMLRIRGMESNSTTKYAEAFYCRKMVLV
jgi:LmbE family N-acetylglucosaminyl deacetylase